MKSTKSLYTFVLASLLASPALAEPIHQGLSDKWRFDFTAVSYSPEATLRSTVPGDPPTEVTLDDLNADDDETTGQFSITGRFSDKWRASFAYTDLSVSGYNINSRNFNFDGVDYPLQTELDTELDVTMYIAAVDYAIHQSDTTEFGIGAGLHAIDLDISFVGSLNGITVGSSSEDFLAPLPNIRGYVRHAFNEKWLFGAGIGWMGAEIDEYDGSLLLGSAFLDYRINNNWTLGVNYQYIEIDLEIDDNLSEDEYDVELPGLGISVTYSIPK